MPTPTITSPTITDRAISRLAVAWMLRGYLLIDPATARLNYDKLQELANQLEKLLSKNPSIVWKATILMVFCHSQQQTKAFTLPSTLESVAATIIDFCESD